MNEAWSSIIDWVTNQQTLIQLTIVVFSFVIAQIVTKLLGKRFKTLRELPSTESKRPSELILHSLGKLLFPVLGLLLLKISSELITTADQDNWLITTAITTGLVFLYIYFVREFIHNTVTSKAMLYIGVPLLVLQSTGLLPYINSAFESVSMQVGNIKISLAGVLRVTIFGTSIFWLGRVSNNSAQKYIRNQEKIDYRTREVAAKLFEISIFVVVFLVLLQIIGINLTALAVFGGALGVGLGFGLQAIASNFISGLIILLDRSLSIGDFVELEDGRSGFVTSLNMRSTTLETFDGKDIMVPNEMFITSTFINWTHKNKKQRYRVDF